jgi:hypothetical protein
MERHEEELETRDVRVDDPTLSPAANRGLTEELQKAVGAKQVRVPRSTPHHERDIRGDGRGLGPLLGRNRLLIGVTLAAALVVGAIFTVVTGAWWSLLIAVGVHALGTLAVALLVLEMSSQPESPGPELLSELEAEGVPAPEKAFNDLVEEFSGRTRGHGPSEVFLTGNEQRSRPASGASPGAAAAEQSTAWTPTEDPSEPAGNGSFVMGIQWLIVVGVAILSLVVAIVNGGLAWLAPALLFPFCAGWAGYQMIALRGADHRAERHAGDTRSEAFRVAVLTAGVIVAVEAVAVVVVILGSASD